MIKETINKSENVSVNTLIENGKYCMGVIKKMDPDSSVEIWKYKELFYWRKKYIRKTHLRKNVITKESFKIIKLSSNIKSRKKEKNTYIKYSYYRYYCFNCSFSICILL